MYTMCITLFDNNLRSRIAFTDEWPQGNWVGAGGGIFKG